MKILFLARMYLPHQGGVEKHLSEISAELKASHQITVVTEQHDSSLPLREKIDEIEVWRIPVRGERGKKLQIWRWWFRHLYLCWQADVIHIHDVFFWLLPFRFLVWPKQIFMTFHGYEGHDPTWKEIFWHRLAAFFSEGSIAVGQFHQKWYGVHSDFYSYGGVRSSKKRIKEKAKITKLIFVGRLAEDTGILLYLAAVKKMAATGHKLTLDIYGAGPLKADCQKMANDMKTVISLKDAQAISPTLYLQYSVAFVSGYLSILEALSVGVSVVAVTNENAEIKSDYLYMTPFANWISIANTAKEIMKAVLTSESAVPEAQEWAQTQTWKKLAEMYQQLWKKYA